MNTAMATLAGLTAALVAGGAQPARAEEIAGHYKGTYSNTGQCSGGGPSELMIRDRSFTRKFGPNTTFDVTVGPDGRFTSQYGQTTLTGSVRNGHVEIDIVAARGDCRSHQVLDKG